MLLTCITSFICVTSSDVAVTGFTPGMTRAESFLLHCTVGYFAPDSLISSLLHKILAFLNRNYCVFFQVKCSHFWLNIWSRCVCRSVASHVGF